MSVVGKMSPLDTGGLETCVRSDLIERKRNGEELPVVYAGRLVQHVC